MKLFATVTATFLAAILTVEVVTADVATAHKRLRFNGASRSRPTRFLDRVRANQANHAKEFGRNLQDEELSIPQTDTASAAEPKGETSGTPETEAFDTCVADYGPQGDVSVAMGTLHGGLIESYAWLYYTDPSMDVFFYAFFVIVEMAVFAQAAILAGQNVDGCGTSVNVDGNPYGIEYYAYYLQLAFWCAVIEDESCCAFYPCGGLDGFEAREKNTKSPSLLSDIFSRKNG